MVTQAKSLENEILKGIQKDNRCYYALKNLLRFKPNLKNVQSYMTLLRSIGNHNAVLGGMLRN